MPDTRYQIPDTKNMQEHSSETRKAELINK